MFCACWVQLDGVDDDESHVTVVCECCFEYGPHLKQGGLVYIHSNKHKRHKMQNCCMSTCESNKAMEGQGDMCLGDGERGMMMRDNHTPLRNGRKRSLALLLVHAAPQNLSNTLGHGHAHM